MLSFVTPAMQRNAPSLFDRAERPENRIADRAGREHYAKRPSSLCATAGEVRHAGGGAGAPAYSLRGRFAARHTCPVPAELTARFKAEPEPAPQAPRWYSVAIFLAMSTATLFAMCAMGRPGA